MVFGLGMLAVAVWVDFRARASYAQGRDFAFWLYLFGTLAFWSGLTMQQSNSELGKFVYLLINVALLAAGAVACSLSSAGSASPPTSATSPAGSSPTACCSRSR
jgi:thiol:disulfide interchange protein